MTRPHIPDWLKISIGVAVLMYISILNVPTPAQMEPHLVTHESVNQEAKFMIETNKVFSEAQ